MFLLSWIMGMIMYSYRHELYTALEDLSNLLRDMGFGYVEKRGLVPYDDTDIRHLKWLSAIVITHLLECFPSNDWLRHLSDLIWLHIWLCSRIPSVIL